MNFYAYLTFVGISAAVGCYGLLSKKLDRSLNLIVYVVIITFFVELLADYCKHQFHNNLWVYHINHAIEYGMYSLFIYQSTTSKFLKKFIPVSIICFITYLIINAIVDPTLQVNLKWPAVLKGFGLTICSIMYIGGLFVYDEKNPKLNVEILIIVTGILFFFSFSALYFAIQQYIGGTPDQYLNPQIKLKINELGPLLYITNTIMYFSMGVAFAISMLKKKGKQQVSRYHTGKF